ncbi:MAG: type II secretion system major pseudopilin GspG [Phycisphaerae bacterium]|nr:type II secretion system major pseudopilin GspG [Phycisphaerae bacterium]
MNNRKAFTIVEMLIVVMLIALLAVLMVPKFIGQLDVAQEKLVKPKMATLAQALTLYKGLTGNYPTQAQGLKALIDPPADVADKWKNDDIKKDDLLDPWNNPFEYVIPGQTNTHSFDLISYGPDGKKGGGDDFVND